MALLALCICQQLLNTRG